MLSTLFCPVARTGEKDEWELRHRHFVEPKRVALAGCIVNALGTSAGPRKFLSVKASVSRLKA